MPDRIPSFDMEILRAADTARVVLRGELDLATAPEVTRALEALATEPELAVFVDLRALRFMDSTGLRLLIQADARARAEGHALVMIRGPERIARLFTLTGVDGLLQVVDAPPLDAP